MQQHNQVSWSKYLIVFLITLGLFFSAWYLSNTFSNKKLKELQSIQDNISLDLLSSETQFDLLGDLDCSQISNSVLSQELNDLSQKIEYSETNLGKSDEVIRLKKLYSLLEIKDYLLMKRMSEKCGQKNVFIFYFYTTKENCSECVKQGYVLTALREKYPALRVYSFDYGLDLSVISTLIHLYKIEDTKLPAIVSDRNVYTGFKSVEEIETLIPKLKDTLPVETTTKATDSSKQSTSSKSTTTGQ